MSWLGSRKLRAGDLVEIRSAEEIAATLGPDATLDALPFMPEMLRHCGQRVRVSKRSHKSCDTINKTGNRRMDRTVHLEDLRCDGSAHGGCQAGCLLFWKEEWLRPVSDASPVAPTPRAQPRRSRDSSARRQASRSEPKASEDQQEGATPPQSRTAVRRPSTSPRAGRSGASTSVTISRT